MNQTHSIAKKIIANSVVPVFYHAQETICLKVLEACYVSGLRVFEFTNRGENALHIFKVLQKAIQTDFIDMLLGAGTIFEKVTANAFADAGANFIVSPALIPEMKSLQTENVLWIPGCATLSELVLARTLGSTLMKVFPAEVVSPKFIAHALSVMPGLHLMPTGGVEATREQLSTWFQAGAACVGLGSQLIAKELIATANWQMLTVRIQETLVGIKEIKQSL
jgi:2-dehydro-3-deoxyphosphogluconate aldolase/(4S)-4-hydroxy-2-oxoglutarate aldolase